MKRKTVALVLLLVLCSLGMVFAQGVNEKIPVKVLVIAMFEVGENAGDFAGEFQHWYEKYFDGATAYEVNGHINPLFVNADGVAGTVAGMGKANSASSTMAVLSDPRFDFSQTYILVSGCSGMSPERGTLGDAVWAYELVDYELGNGWQQSDRPVGVTDTFRVGSGYAEAGYIVLNAGLTNWAYDLSKNVELIDDPAAAKYRANYGSAYANLKPSVRYGISMTGDNYWHGPAGSARADEICAAYGTTYEYMVTQMEDNAVALAARRFGLLDRMLVCRDVVNFDQNYPGQTVLESLDASSGAFSIGMRNGFLAATVVVDELISNWEVYATTIPTK